MLRKFLHYIDIRDELEDFDNIHTEIEKGIAFKGTNLWILVFAIIVASVGLNTNSTAVIIGAMLISPLMGPINGMGYSLATYNFELFRRALRNFLFAVVASLAASTLYFTISPVSTAHSELLARTSPTIYDVLIALFGGLAGIVAISSRMKGNVLPGVAIATALMPPLCTAGYGLATGQFTFFFGAFYLFTINTVFIGISSVVMSQALKFPIRTLVDPAQKKRVNQYISLIIAITLLPSIYFGYELVQKERFTERAKQFTNSVLLSGGAYLLKNEINATKKSIRLVYGGNSMSEETKREIINKAKDFDLADAELIFDQGFSLNEKQLDENELLKSKISALTFSIEQNEKQKDSVQQRQQLGARLLKEIQANYQGINSCLYAESIEYSDSAKKSSTKPIVAFTTIPGRLSTAEKTKIRNWLQIRLQQKEVNVYFEDAIR
jgi:uncharacterized hydrophobic protein (TIGR00271 family)